MKALEKEIQEIKRMKKAIETTDSVLLKRDYQKNINKRMKEIKYYCSYTGIDFLELKKRI